MIWQNKDDTKLLKVPTGKGRGLIMCHTRCARYVFIKGAKLVYRSYTGNFTD